MSGNFTEREIRMLVTSWLCFDEEPKLNKALLGKYLELAPKTITNQFWEVRKKIATMKAAAEANDGNPSATIGLAAAAADGDGAGQVTPTKRKARTPKKTKKTTKDGDDDDAEGSPANKRRTTPAGKGKGKKEEVAAAATSGDSEGQIDAADEGGDIGSTAS